MSACLPWWGAMHADGYGRHRLGVLAHRHVYSECFGDPGELVVHHRCENRACVNPAHLEAMTRAAHSRLHDNPRSSREARRAATACVHGHAYTTSNTGWGNGRRRCKTCDRLRKRATYVPKAMRA